VLPNFCDWSDEPVAFSHHRLDEARFLGIIAQHLTYLANGGVDAVLGVDEDFGAPEPLHNFCSGDEVSVSGRQENQQLHRLPFQPQAASGPVECEMAGIQLEFAELEDCGGHWRVPRRKSITRRAGGPFSE
jgi:hypothetical protein